MVNLVKKNSDKYNNKYLATTRLGTYNDSEIRISCNLHYFRQGKKKSLNSYGATIVLSGDEIIKYPITTKFLFQITKKMFHLGVGKFSGIKPISYTEFKNMK